MATVPTGADKVPIDMLMHREDDNEKGSIEEAVKPSVTFTEEEEKGLLRKLDWRLLPMMMATWALAYYGLLSKTPAEHSLADQPLVDSTDKDRSSCCTTGESN